MRLIIFSLCLFVHVGLFADPPKQIRVYVDMVGDLFHAGHVEMLKRAKAQGDYLIVGLDDDDYIEQYKRRPIITFDERRKVVEACKYVDEVRRATEYSISGEWILSNDIDLVIHGNDYSEEVMQARYGEVIALGRFLTLPYTPGISTTDIIQRVKKRE